MDPSLLAEDEAALRAEAEQAKERRRAPVLLFPSEVEALLQSMWEQEAELMQHVWGSVSSSGPLQRHPPASDSSSASLLFLRVLAVAPSRFRPPSLLNGVEADHPHNAHLRSIIEADARIRRMAAARSGLGQGLAAAEEQQLQQQGDTHWPHLIANWLQLQESVAALLDSGSASASASSRAPQAGIRQLLERKQGLFRRNMMGKRVNFAARSVISPDPFIASNEIAVPELFATQLTFPEPVTAFNVASLRLAVCNGPDVHPGAVAVEDERGVLVSLAHKTAAQRAALAKTLLTGGGKAGGRRAGSSSLQVKRVLRHIRNGDVMLVNRQPTLHKPSMMTHRVRVLRGRSRQWQTIRMAYANCNAYNADFDGDEMNLHLPQSQLARSEAYHIAATDQQYVVPTDGSPLRGLIQDNVLSGVLLTKLDCFLSRSQFQQLLFSCLEVDPSLPLLTPTPAVLRPAELFTGKQLITAVLRLLTHGRPALNLLSKAKVPAANWAQHAAEASVCVRDGELLHGVLDKSQFGDAAYGLVHAVYELYGALTAGQLLSTLGRLFTLFLQTAAFTCGIDDLLIADGSERQRQQLIAEALSTGRDAACEFAAVRFDPQQPAAASASLQRLM